MQAARRAPWRKRVPAVAASRIGGQGSGATEAGHPPDVRAIVQSRYGELDDLHLTEIERPRPGLGEVLVRVRAASVHADNWHAVRGRPAILRLMGAGFLRPKIPVPGIDVAGDVEELGAGVDVLAPGDAVYGEIAGGFQWKNAGAWAEYVAVDAAAVERKPEGIDYPAAAVVPTSASLALQAVRDEGRVSAGDSVLINGAGGAVGTFAVQIARELGASVTAVDRGAKLERLRALGASETIDFETEDVTERGGRFDAIIDIASTLRVSEWRSMIAPEGTYVMIGHDDYGRRGRGGRRWLGSIPHFLGLAVSKPFLGHLPDWNATPSFREKFAAVHQLICRGAIEPVVDRTFLLDEAADALRHLATGTACGQIALRIP